MTPTSAGLMAIVDACRSAAPPLLPAPDQEPFLAYLRDLASGRLSVPRRGRGFNWPKIALEAGISASGLGAVRSHLTPVLQAYAAPAGRREPRPPPALTVKGRRGRPTTPIVAFPDADPKPWDDPNTFRAALDLHMRRHGDTAYGLHRALLSRGGKISLSTLAI